MKKFLTTFIALGLSFTIVNSAFGATGKIINGKTMVPVRGVFENLGFEVFWDSENATAVIANYDYTIEIPKGKNYFFVNGVSIKPDVPQQIIGGGLYIPLRAIADSIGADTSWNSSEKMAHITYGEEDVYVNCKNQLEYALASVPKYYVYPSGEYKGNGLTFSVNMYTSCDEEIGTAQGVIYTNDSYENSIEIYSTKEENIYTCKGGVLSGATIGFTENSMIVADGGKSGVYGKTKTYMAP